MPIPQFHRTPKTRKRRARRTVGQDAETEIIAANDPLTGATRASLARFWRAMKLRYRHCIPPLSQLCTRALQTLHACARRHPVSETIRLCEQKPCRDE